MPTWLKKLGLSWSQIKSLLETEGAKNKAYDIDNDGLVENIRFKEVAELPDAPRDYEVVVLNSILRVYDPVKSTWRLIRSLTGYDGFDNNAGGLWTKYINIPITSTPSEYAQYKVVIDSNNVTVYSADGTQKAQGAVASDFWANVKSNGSDIRVFDQAKSQLYFWIEKWDYSNKKAVIWVKLEAGSSELNIAYGNPSATKSNYENGEQVFEFFEDFTDPSGWQTSGTVDFSQGYARVLRAAEAWTDLSLQYGVWELDIRKESKSHTMNIGFIVTDDVFTNCYKIYWQGATDNKFAIQKVVEKDVTNLASTTIASDTNWHKLKIIRKTDGTFEVYLDGELKLTATDTEEITANYFMIHGSDYNGANTYADYDNIKVFKLTDPADFGTPQILEF